MTLRRCFRKREHILKTKDFREVYKKGRRSKRAGVQLYCLANGLGFTRLGFSIPSAAVKLATRRNRIRRLLREAFRRNKAALRRDVDIVITVRALPPKTMTFNQAEEIFLKLAGEAGAASR